MRLTFERFTTELTRIVSARGADGLNEIARNLQPLLVDPAFEAFGFPDESMRKRVLFHDPQTGVYVLAHLQQAGKSGKPHSHGASWAIYGNVRGYTDMTEWRRCNAETEDYAVLEVASRYRLGPGDSRAYPPHLIHSTSHPESARVIRITGTDLDRIARYSFNPAKDRMLQPSAE
jgi:hypothetical protein